MHSLATSYDLVKNIFLKTLFNTKSNDLICRCPKFHKNPTYFSYPVHKQTGRRADGQTNVSQKSTCHTSGWSNKCSN